MDKLNPFESFILNRLAVRYPQIRDHIPLVEVSSREITGVGMYVNFKYRSQKELFQLIDLPDCAISKNENFEVKDLVYGLGYEVVITGGKLDFIEVITYDDEIWDGNVESFKLFNQED